jgi:hypothetical protein
LTAGSFAGSGGVFTNSDECAEALGEDDFVELLVHF